MISLKVVQILKKHAYFFQWSINVLLIDKNRTKTRNDLVLKIENLKLKKKIEQIIETTKVKKKLVESLINSHFENFVFFSNVADLVSVLVNVSKKNKNLLDRNEIIEIFFTISIDVTHDVFSCTFNDENNYVFIDRIIIRIDE